ncbi:hypothetical protein MHJ97_04455 [Macrococcus epidermidis]|nr:3-alpha domain-containing protein [Macrococcus epidermidis]MCG7419683.1 hypothetical protein [Macrococcus epidermidis]
MKKDETGLTLHEFNELVYGDKKNKALIEKALKVDALPEEHKEKFAKHL